MNYILGVLLFILAIIILGLLLSAISASPPGRDISLVLPEQCEPENIISVSNGKTGLVLGYRTVGGQVRAALYPNPQDGSHSEFIFVFVKDK